MIASITNISISHIYRNHKGPWFRDNQQHFPQWVPLCNICDQFFWGTTENLCQPPPIVPRAPAEETELLRGIVQGNRHEKLVKKAITLKNKLAFEQYTGPMEERDKILVKRTSVLL